VACDRIDNGWHPRLRGTCVVCYRTLGRFCICAYLALAIIAGTADAQNAQIPAELSLETALRIFRERGFDLIIADAAVESAAGDVRVAGAVPNPALGLSFLHTFTYNPNDPSCVESHATCSANGFGITLSDQAAVFDTLAGKRGLRLRVARAALAAARQSRSDAQRTLEFQVKQQYIQATLARNLLAFAIEVQKSNTRTFELSRVRHDTGTISEADLVRVETAKLEADQAVATARQGVATTKAGLAFLLGVRGEIPPFNVQPDLPPFVVPPALALATRASLLKDAFERRPDLQALTFQRERAEASVRLAQRLRFPDITLSANYTQQGKGGKGTNAPLTPPTWTVGISAPLPLFYQQQGEIQKAQADLRTQVTQRDKTQAQIVNDVGTAYATFVTTRELVERMQGRLLESAKRARDLVEFQYKEGAAALLEFLDAQRTYIATNVEYLQDLANYWTAVYQLEAAVGTELR
jgi:cobalt-zinc-cadmium efflux system outer membrane protein